MTEQTPPEAPSREHIDAVARAIACPMRVADRHREQAHALLTVDDHLTHAALAAALPDKTLIAEARKRGIWKRSRCGCGWCCNDVPAGQAGHVHLRTCPAQKGATT